MEENKQTPETEAPEAEEKKAEEEATEAEKKEKKDKKFFHRDQKELEAAKAQLAEKENQYLRLYAEYENFRKRSEKEKTDCYNSAYGDALTAFLPLIDSMTQAMQFSPEDEGIKALAKQLSDILTKLSITEIESDGAQFDPNVHNAVFHVEDEAFGENEIVEVLMKGYQKGDKVIRYAIVKVAN